MDREKILRLILSRLPFVVGLFSVAVFGVAVSLIVNGFVFEKSFELDSKIPNLKKQREKVSDSKVDFSGIELLFGEVGNEENGAISSPVKALRETKEYKVIGTVSTGGRYLLVVEKEGKWKFLKVGDHISGGKLVEIGQFYYEVIRNGNRVRIPIFGIDKKERGRATPTLRQQQRPGDEKKVKVVKLDKTMVERETADIGKLLKDVAIYPVIRKGQTVGYRFARIKRGSILRKIGFKPGDIVIAVNDVPVTTVDDTFKIYNILRNEDTVKVEIERRGRKEVIVYEIH